MYYPRPKLSCSVTTTDNYQALGVGSVLLKLTTGQHFLIKDVLYVLGLAKNLLSMAQITSTGNTTIITFTQDHCVINTISPKSNQPMLFRIPKHGNLFSLGTGIDPLTHNYSATVTQNDHDAIKWHYRLGHLNYRFLGTMQIHDMVIGLPVVQPLPSLCLACTLGKQHRT